MSETNTQTTVTMTDSIQISDINSRPSMTNGGTIDGNGETLSYTGERNSDNGSVGVLTTTGGSVSNLTIDGGENGRALFVTSLTKDLCVENCVLDGAYSFNASINPPAVYSISFTNTEFKSWVSYGNGVLSASFNNCDFDYYLRPYCNTDLTSCTFAEGFELNVLPSISGITITLTDCFVGDTLVTADNVVSLLHLDEHTKTWVTINNTP